MEIVKIKGYKETKKLLIDWHEFQIEWDFIAVPKEDNYIEQQAYLQRIRDITPPIVCYHG